MEERRRKRKRDRQLEKGRHKKRVREREEEKEREKQRMKGRQNERNNSSFDIQFGEPKTDPQIASKYEYIYLCVHLRPAPKLFRINEHFCKIHIRFAVAVKRNAGRICYFTIGNENIYNSHMISPYPLILLCYGECEKKQATTTTYIE